ncbi:MAG: hypothetical protein GWN79_16945 [Actinobacteria bacterium]|nr:hypothetical protein [Actinomycetota bacterium]NIS33633.1 hypothetical protein [Actinomycetota bacterium]NIT96988.1 hypothetical protein [Actinomycetota bacterium]NIU20653.1 hypothetical protein [Actinomycetota bacterium]NIU68492.1 hypothetical protein [Actinomycetota bacterium]
MPEDSKYQPGVAPTQPSSPTVGAPTANRSPEEVRQMLSRYRAGLRKGRDPDSDQTDQKRRS